MPKNISMAMTTEQTIAEKKTVTRRDGWESVKPGDLLNPVDKTMGFKKGDGPMRLLRDGRGIRVKAVSRSKLNTITPSEVRKEGFPDMTPAEFVEMYVKANGGPPDKMVTRILYEYVDDPAFVQQSAEQGVSLEDIPEEQEVDES